MTQPLSYPATRKEDVVDDYHGTLVPDPYRWLEDANAADTQAWVAYPPTLIATADTDDRVVPMHAKKLAATLQAATGGDGPVLLRVETKAGHGLGKPTAKVIAELADILAFLAAHTTT